MFFTWRKSVKNGGFPPFFAPSGRPPHSPTAKKIAPAKKIIVLLPKKQIVDKLSNTQLAKTFFKKQKFGKNGRYKMFFKK